MITKREALSLTGLPKKHFDNYFMSSCEIQGVKESGRWRFDEQALQQWLLMKEWSTVELTQADYMECFEFAFKMAYVSNAAHGTGIRGQRSEVQKTDDFIFGILAEYGVRSFMHSKFGIDIGLDMDVHPDHITAQDVISVRENGIERPAKVNIAIKSSKMKSCWNVIDPLEYDDPGRRSEVYIFTRVEIPTDHLFRAVRDHSLFDRLHAFLDLNPLYKKLDPLPHVKVWICGYSNYGEFDRVKKIPGQDFSGDRYVKSVGEMHKTEDDWRSLAERL